MTKECVLKQMDDQANSLNFKNNYDQNMELTEEEVKTIFYLTVKQIIIIPIKY